MDNKVHVVKGNEVSLFNLSEAESKQPFLDLEHFVHKFAPAYQPIMAKVIRGEDVDTRDINKIQGVLLDKLVPLYNSDGGLSDPEMAHLHETLVNVGRQL